MHKTLLIVGFCILLGLSFVAGKFFSYTSDISNSSKAEGCSDDYAFINPQFNCGESQVVKKHGYAELIASIEDVIEKEKADGVVDTVSVFFRDLNNGPSFGINDQERFIPASLFKLPIMLAYFQLVDDEDFSLKTQIAYGETKEEVSKQFYPPKEEVKPHTPYSLDELIFRMIAYSDNKATAALVSDLKNLSRERKKDLIYETYVGTGVVYPDAEDESVITVRSYASLYRILYNASYLSNKMSEKALETLAQADFSKGLVKGVPEGIRVAHKFGERFDDKAKDDVEQFHDCGIIYYPDNPYLLCVMTKGKYIPSLVTLTAKISEMVYKEVDSRRIE